MYSQIANESQTVVPSWVNAGTLPEGEYFKSSSLLPSIYSGILVGEVEREYMNSILSNFSLKSWISEGVKEKEYLEEFEVQA